MIKISWPEILQLSSVNQVPLIYVEKDQEYRIYLTISMTHFTSLVFKESSEALEFETLYKSKSNSQFSVVSSPFSSKKIGTRSLYKRVHGIKSSLSIGLNSITFVTPHPECKITGVEIIGGSIGDTVSFKILDTATGTISTIPNHMLNQFGFNVNVCAGLYEHKSEYDADLFQGLQILVEYSSIDEKSVGFNFILNEVK